LFLWSELWYVEAKSTKLFQDYVILFRFRMQR
jgi:hypothetical protein